MLSRLPRVEPSRYSNRPLRANRLTKRSISLSAARPPVIDASGSPLRSSPRRLAIAGVNFPRPWPYPSKRATTFPSACPSSVTCSLRRAAMSGGEVLRPLIFFLEVAKPGASPSAMRQVRRQLILRYRCVAQAEFHGNIVKAAGPKAAIEVPQAWNNHAGDRRLDIRPRLVENQEIQA